MKTYTITAEQLKDPLANVKYPGANKPGEYCYSEERNSFYQSSAREFAPVSEISSGLGIGGAGSDDYNIHSDYVSNSAHYHKCGRGQRYDERCDGCGRVTAVCNDCGLCAKCHGPR